jgi:hypothetical protein
VNLLLNPGRCQQPVSRITCSYGYNKGKLTGLGASTLKALRDLQVGAHWALSGWSGEYAAGNGAAMINEETENHLNGYQAPSGTRIKRGRIVNHQGP